MTTAHDVTSLVPAASHQAGLTHLLDRSAAAYRRNTATRFGDRTLTYAELAAEVRKAANAFESLGVAKGDRVAVYLPMIPEAVITMLACARIGAVHSVIFAGFSAESLRDRIVDCKSRVVITTDEGRRGGKTIATKVIVDAALEECPAVEHVLVLKRTGKQVPWTEGRDKWWDVEAAKVPAYCPPEAMNSEDPLFILYVSPQAPL